MRRIYSVIPVDVIIILLPRLMLLYCRDLILIYHYCISSSSYHVHLNKLAMHPNQPHLTQWQLKIYPQSYVSSWNPLISVLH